MKLLNEIFPSKDGNLTTIGIYPHMITESTRELLFDNKTQYLALHKLAISTPVYHIYRFDKESIARKFILSSEIPGIFWLVWPMLTSKEK